AREQLRQTGMTDRGTYPDTNAVTSSVGADSAGGPSHAIGSNTLCGPKSTATGTSTTPRTTPEAQVGALMVSIVVTAAPLGRASNSARCCSTHSIAAATAGAKSVGCASPLLTASAGTPRRAAVFA